MDASDYSAITKAAMVFLRGQLGAGNGLNVGTALIGGIAGHSTSLVSPSDISCYRQLKCPLYLSQATPQHANSHGCQRINGCPAAKVCWLAGYRRHHRTAMGSPV